MQLHFNSSADRLSVSFITVPVCIIINLIMQYEYHYMSEYIMSMQHSLLHMWRNSTLYKCAMVSWMLTSLQS